jgi:hypothetical protein
MPNEYPIIPHLAMTIQDGKGKTATVFINSERFDDADFTGGKTYESWSDNIMQDFFPLTGGKIVHAAVLLPITIDTGVIDQSSRPDPDSDVEEGATFVWQTSEGYTTKFRIPTFLESKLISGTDEVDLSDGEVSQFVGTIIDGADAIAGVGEDRMNVTDGRGDDVIALREAYDAFKRYKRRGR